MPPTPGAAAQQIAAGTGLDPVAVQVWIQCEGGPADNPLNIGPGAHPGIQGTIAEINNGSNWGGIRASRGQPAGAQLAAIQASPWDAGHYSNGCLQRVLGEPVGGESPAGAAPSSSSGGGGGFDLQSAIEASLGAFLGLPGGETVHEWVVEKVVRTAELVGGAVLTAIALTMFLDLVVSDPGASEGLIAKGARAGRSLIETAAAASVAG